MTLEEAFDKFIEFKQRQGLSDVSIRDYVTFIAPFVAYIGYPVNLSEVKEKRVFAYIDGLYRQDISKATRSTYIRNVKVFLNWIKKYEGIDLFTSHIVVPKANKKVLRIYGDDDIRLIFKTIHAESDWLTARNRAMVAVMLDSGLRQGEVCDLLSRDVYFEKSMLKVCGKGDKERFVPLGSIAARYMKEYRFLCPYHESNFFVSRRGEPVSRDSVKHFMYKLAQELPFEFSSHKLRHNFATNYCLDQYEMYGKIDIFRLMILMGHEDVKTTNRYLHIANEIIASRENVSHMDRIFLDI